MLLKVFVLLPVFFLTSAFKSVINRRNQKICTEQAPEITAMTSVLIILISYFLMKKKNKKITLASISVAFLFFVASQLYFNSNSLLTPMVETICGKANILVVFILNFLFISKKIHVTQIFGLICLITSYLMISAGKKEPSFQMNELKYIFIYTLCSALEGLAFFDFDYFILEKIEDFFHYAFLAQSFNLLFNFFHLVYCYFNGKISLLKYASDFNYYKIIFLEFGISALWFCLSFSYDLVPRTLISTVIRTLSDVSAEGYLYEWKFDNMGWYFLCVAGVIIYQSKEIMKYFLDRKN